MDMRQYMAGRRTGERDARSGDYRPQDFASEPADFRQGWIDGWEETREALNLRG
jgi:hypothetical protein